MNIENGSLENLKFRIQVLESDIIIYKQMIKCKDKNIRNLRTRLHNANMEIRKLKEIKTEQLTIFDYK